MRKLNLSVWALFMLALTAMANAEDMSPLKDTPHFNTCRDEAKLKADNFVGDYIAPATDEDTAPAGTYVAIVYGRKFVAPLHPPANGDKQLHGLGEVLLKRRQVYREEFRRCLGYVEFNLALKQHIFIFE
jgi:hypothetical protein